MRSGYLGIQVQSNGIQSADPEQHPPVTSFQMLPDPQMSDKESIYEQLQLFQIPQNQLSSAQRHQVQNTMAQEFHQPRKPTTKPVKKGRSRFKQIFTFERVKRGSENHSN